MKLNKEQISILNHTVNRAANGFYCGGGSDMDELCSNGLMELAGMVAWCPDKFYKITEKGREALKKFQQRA